MVDGVENGCGESGETRVELGEQSGEIAGNVAETFDGFEYLRDLAGYRRLLETESVEYVGQFEVLISVGDRQLVDAGENEIVLTCYTFQ